MKRIIPNLVFFLQILILFLLIFEERAAIPSIVQPLGRMHPLVLHFPVVLLFLWVIFQFMKNRIDEVAFRAIDPPLLQLTVLTTSLTALMGLFLSLEPGYDADALAWHKWGGVALSFIAYFILLIENFPRARQAIGIVALLCVIITGHQGAEITHGKNYLIEPLLVSEPTFDPEMDLYTGIVQPILDRKCASCHNPGKKKGGLDLSSLGGLLAGGKNGMVIMEEVSGDSELIARIHLPEDNEDRMPPEGKPQLSLDEIAILEYWIQRGSDGSLKLSDLEETDSLFQLASARISRSPGAKKNYDFDEADPDLIRSLNNPYRSVSQATLNSPALDAHIYVAKAYKTEFLEELQKVSEQLVSLNLSYLPLEGSEYKLISGFSNLEKLVLNYTPADNTAITDLAGLENLEVLALAGCSVDENIMPLLEQFPSLQEVYLWDTRISVSQLDTFALRYPEIIFNKGYDPTSDESLKISVPRLVRDVNVISREDKIELIHAIQDVSIFYTTDGNEPDSSSTLYNGPFSLAEAGTVRTIAYKAGWEPSDIAAYSFYIRGHRPVEISLLNPPNPQYRGNGGLTLMDDEKGDIIAFTTPRWLGFREQDMNVLVDMGENAPTIEFISVSYGLNIRSYIMKPVKVSLYGGNSENSLKLLSTVSPEPSTDYEPNGERGINIPTGGNAYRYYRIVAEPVRKLPEWHVGAGDQGWVFVDELFFY